jgi:iron(II)-dependent oxidoreductase
MVFALVACASAVVIPRDPPPGMVVVPAGWFAMGSAPNPALAWFEQGVDETPQHRVKLPTFWIDRHEVTETAYANFVQQTGHRAPRLWAGERPRRHDHPVSDLSWDDANAYCRWAGKRLPTEAEWEKAARGGDGRLWPWGSDYRAGTANLQDSGRGDTVPVGSYPNDVSPYGVLDMAGNVMEWTASWYEPYQGSTLARPDFGRKYRVLKGGAWTTPPLPFSRAANRHAIAPKWDHPHFGVRCAKDAG